MEGNVLKSFYLPNTIEAGCDEAGRGCLAGAVFAAAVILPPDFTHPLLTDSKQIDEKTRYELRSIIQEQAIAWAVSQVDMVEIDSINILNAAIKAMHLSLDKLSIRPEHIIIDGNRFKKYQDIPHLCIVEGDAKYFSIAAASILAKTYRDDYMNQIDKEYPEYSWSRNKGYATKKHRLAIQKLGISPYHRRSFRLIDAQKSFVF